MKHIWLTLVIIMFCSVPCRAQQAVQYDNEILNIRLPDEKKIEDYRNSKEFFIDANARPPETIFQRILRWIIYIWRNYVAASRFYPVARYIIFIGLLVLIILQLTRTKLSSLFYKSRKNLPIVISELDINMDDDELDKVIAKEIKAKNYRPALRFLYIKLLKLLSAKDLIYWRKGKTDYDYFMELAGSHHQEDFKKLSVVYEYTWYGNFIPKEDQFVKVHSDFNHFFNMVDAKE